jgi:AraC family transcriptional regulator
MASDADTFGRFVELVASNLDEHAARGGQLAARLYVSRSQLDRVVTAASGEAPGRFRRRILLERAAYRLIAGDLSVLDVAVEASYSYNEAFTRAFRRAYGVAPSAWRTRPESVHLDDPNGVHFHAPVGLSMPASLTHSSTAPSTSPSRASTRARRCVPCCHPLTWGPIRPTGPTAP